MAYKNRVIFDDLRSVAFGAVGAAYGAIGARIDEPARIMHIYNDLDVSVFISDDGVNNKIFLPVGGFFIFDYTANKVRDDGFFFPEGYLYVKRAAGAPSSGSIYLTVIHD